MTAQDLEQFNQAVGQAQAGQKAIAHAAFERLSQTNPGEAGIWLWLAFTAPDLRQAARYIEEAGRLDSTNPGLAAARRWLDGQQQPATGRASAESNQSGSTANEPFTQTKNAKTQPVAATFAEQEESQAPEELSWAGVGALYERQQAHQKNWLMMAIGVALGLFGGLIFYVTFNTFNDYNSLPKYGARMRVATGVGQIIANPIFGNRYIIAYGAGYLHASVDVSETLYNKITSVDRSQDLQVNYLPDKLKIAQVVGDDASQRESIVRGFLFGVGFIGLGGTLIRFSFPRPRPKKKKTLLKTVK